MRIIGTCPCCGNPIYGKRKSSGRVVQDPLRTCFCVPINTKPLQYATQTQSAFSVTTPYSTSGTTGITVTQPKPPDEDGALVT